MDHNIHTDATGFSVNKYVEPTFSDSTEKQVRPKRVLLVVDYQNDFVTGIFGSDNARAIAGPIAEKVRSYQSCGDIVIFTMDTHLADQYAATREGSRSPIHCVPGTDGWDLHGPVRELLTPEKAILVKQGTFGSVDVVSVLKNMSRQGVDIGSIELIGVSTGHCVLHNAIILYNFFPTLEIAVSRVATACSTETEQDNVLRQLESFGIVIS